MIRKIKTSLEKRDIKKNGAKLKITMVEDGELFSVEFRADKIDFDYKNYWKGDKKFEIKAVGKNNIK